MPKKGRPDLIGDIAWVGFIIERTPGSLIRDNYNMQLPKEWRETAAWGGFSGSARLIVANEMMSQGLNGWGRVARGATREFEICRHFPRPINWADRRRFIAGDTVELARSPHPNFAKTSKR
jgi:hypothetical protein